MASRKALTPAQRAAATQRQVLYRERQKLAKAGKPIPAAIAPKRPATYRPPSVKVKAVLGGRTASEVQARALAHARYRASQSAAQRASDKATATRNARAAIIRQLPQAHNALAPIHVSEETGRSVGRTAEAAKIRKARENQKIQAVGRGLKRDFKDGSFEGLENSLESAHERARYREATRRISAVSAQALAIYFHYEGGSGEFTNAGKAIRYPVDGGDADDGLKRLEALAKAVELADERYGASSPVGKLDI